MRTLPAYSAFKLTKAIDTVPAGATGQLNRLDLHHVALTFDNKCYPDLVFDVNDTEPHVRASIEPIANPNTRPTRYWRRVAALIAAAFVVGWVFQPPGIVQAAQASVIEYVLTVW